MKKTFLLIGLGTAFLAVSLWVWLSNGKSAKAVKKTLTIPEWLNVLAEKKGINFSQTLQNALLEKLEVGK